MMNAEMMKQMPHMMQGAGQMMTHPMATGAMMGMSHTSPMGQPGDSSNADVLRLRRPVASFWATCLPCPQVFTVEALRGS